MNSSRKLQLNTGAFIPIIATGTFGLPTGDDVDKSAYVNAEGKIEPPKVKDWLVQALKNGYRHIDTAVIYQTEADVGRAIKESGIPREELFVTTKLPWTHYSRVAESFQESLDRLGLEYVDLYLIHWPQSLAYAGDEFFPKNEDGTLKTIDSPNFHDAWAEMEKLFESGKAKAIGVSNFSIKTLEELLKTAKVTPAANQVELHPYLAQNDLRKYCLEKGIIVEAYTPSGYSTVRNDPVIVEVAKKYNATPNQVILAWHVARDTVIIPKSAQDARQKENINLPTLDQDDIAKISSLDRGQRIGNKPDANGMVWGWTTERMGW